MPGYKCSIRERMLYSSCKNPLVDMVENKLQIEIEKKVRNNPAWWEENKKPVVSNSKATLKVCHEMQAAESFLNLQWFSKISNIHDWITNVQQGGDIKGGYECGSIWCCSNWSIDRKLIDNYFDGWFVFFQAKMPNFEWFQLLKCDDVLPVFVTHDSQLNIFTLWTGSQTKSNF